MSDKNFIGCINGNSIYVSDAALAQYGEGEIMRNLGTIKAFPVKTDLSGNEIMIYAATQEEAINKFLAMKAKK